MLRTISSISAPVMTGAASTHCSAPSTLILGAEPLASKRSEPRRPQRISSHGIIRSFTFEITMTHPSRIRAKSKRPALRAGRFGSPFAVRQLLESGAECCTTGVVVGNCGYRRTLLGLHVHLTGVGDE